jgi:hypothetical protein
MTKSRYLADLVTSIAAFGIGVLCASLLHGKWYYGGWMGWFGDPPAMNPAYSRFAKLFEMFPYVAGGLASGLVAGFGYFEPMRIVIRFGSVVALFFVLLLNNQHLACFGFVPAAIGSFVVSTGLSVVYFRLLIFHQQELKAWAKRWERWRIMPGGKM